MVNKSKRKPVKEKLTDEDKVNLASLVKDNPCLWKLSDANYRKQDVVTAAWIKVSEELGKSVMTCKDGWKGLKDALRYQQTTRKVKKSGDSFSDGDGSGEEFSYDDATDGDKLRVWKFWEPLRFLCEERPKRKTLCSLVLNNTSSAATKNIEVIEEGTVINSDIVLDVSEVPDEILAAFDGHEAAKHEEQNSKKKINEKPGPSKSNYDYAIHPPKKQRKVTAEINSSEDRIAESIQTLVDLRKKEVATVPFQDTDRNLKYYSMYANLDRMLKTLPETVVEELNFQFICLTREAMK